MSKREFVQDKVYLQMADGSVWEYEPMLAKVKGVKKVIPNPSKPKKAEEGTKQETPKQ